jgi:hypothetical protein
MPVAVHLAPPFAEGGEKIRRQRIQVRPLLLEHPLLLRAGGAVDALVGHIDLPVAQVGVLFSEGFEAPPLQRIVLRKMPFSFSL